MFSVTANWIDKALILAEALCVSLSFNALWKGLNLSLLPFQRWIDIRFVGNLNLGEAASLGKRKLWNQIRFTPWEKGPMYVFYWFNVFRTIEDISLRHMNNICVFVNAGSLERIGIVVGGRYGRDTILQWLRPEISMFCISTVLNFLVLH